MRSWAPDPPRQRASKTEFFPIHNIGTLFIYIASALIQDHLKLMMNTPEIAGQSGANGGRNLRGSLTVQDVESRRITSTIQLNGFRQPRAINLLSLLKTADRP